LFGGLRSIIFIVKSDKSIPLASVVSVGYLSKLLKLCLQLGVRCSFIDSIDKELAAFLSVGRSHVVTLVGSLSLSSRITIRQPD